MELSWNGRKSSIYTKVLVIRRKKIVAIPAPAIYGQFNATPGQVLAAIKQIGFDDVIEVALGAEITAANEAKELEELGRKRQELHISFVIRFKI